MTLGLSSAVAGLFQGTTLFLLLAIDVLIFYRLRRAPAVPATPAAQMAAPSPVAAEVAS
jgi:hypothetical protein